MIWTLYIDSSVGGSADIIMGNKMIKIINLVMGLESQLELQFKIF